MSRTGRVESFVVIHQAPSAFADAVPYTVARVVIDTTDEEVVLTSSLIDVPWQEAKVGMRVEVVFDDVTPDVTLPRFRSAGPPVAGVA